MAKDAELLGTGQVSGGAWHFFESPVTGLGGPSGPLLQALEEAVRIVVMLAHGIAKKKQEGQRLRELHDTWAKMRRT
jgi:hypothetical protein